MDLGRRGRKTGWQRPAQPHSSFPLYIQTPLTTAPVCCNNICFADRSENIPRAHTYFFEHVSIHPITERRTSPTISIQVQRRLRKVNFFLFYRNFLWTTPVESTEARDLTPNKACTPLFWTSHRIRLRLERGSFRTWACHPRRWTTRSLRGIVQPKTRDPSRDKLLSCRVEFSRILKCRAYAFGISWWLTKIYSALSKYD